MQMRFWQFDLKLAHRWTISSGLGPGGSGGTEVYPVMLVELRDADGVIGLGESAPSSRYRENVETTARFLQRIDPNRISFSDIAGSIAHVESLSSGDFAPKGALEMALLDGAARRAGQAIHDFLGLGFTEKKHVTSFSIGLDTPDKIRLKVREAAAYPVLKLKVGSPNDPENLAAVRDVAPDKPIRVDANEAWPTKEEALRRLEWLATDGRIQFVEQPMPAASSTEDLAWLKARTPLPLMADESYRSAADLDRCAQCYHSVNVKLVKCGGILSARRALEAARGVGLKTMIGCMIESSVLISAAAHLAELTDYLDIDGNLLITNDPYEGASAVNGIISFAGAPEKFGLRVSARKS